MSYTVTDSGQATRTVIERDLPPKYRAMDGYSKSAIDTPGNTERFKQWDGVYARSDGWVVFEHLHQFNH